MRPCAGRASLLLAGARRRCSPSAAPAAARRTRAVEGRPRRRARRAVRRADRADPRRAPRRAAREAPRRAAGLRAASCGRHPRRAAPRADAARARAIRARAERPPRRRRAGARRRPRRARAARCSAGAYAVTLDAVARRRRRARARRGCCCASSAPRRASRGRASDAHAARWRPRGRSGSAPARPRQAVAKDLLDAYQAPPARAARPTPTRPPSAASRRGCAEAAAQAAGYWPILARPLRGGPRRGRRRPATARTFATLRGRRRGRRRRRASRPRARPSTGGARGLHRRAASPPTRRRAARSSCCASSRSCRSSTAAASSGTASRSTSRSRRRSRSTAAPARRFADLAGPARQARPGAHRRGARRGPACASARSSAQALDAAEGVRARRATSRRSPTRVEDALDARRCRRTWQEPTDESDYDLIALTLDRMEAAVGAGQYRQAEQARLEAYAFFEFGPERRLKSFDPGAGHRRRGPDLVRRRRQAGPRRPDRRPRAARATSTRPGSCSTTKLADAAATLGDSANKATVVTNSAIIVFREGLEAVLILAAITASLRRRRAAACAARC